MDRKIIEPAYITVLCEELHRRGAVIVFTNGVFDLLHPGHVQYLAEARAMGSHLIVALNTDESVRHIKGAGRPIVPLDARAEVMAAMECVSFVTWFDEDTPAEIVRMVRPDILVKGSDWPPDRIVGKDSVEAYGGRVLNLPLLEGYSTTAIIKKILDL
ncbi:MAG TPA: D-glycero-beta-D-manno-heptose 1-phosphate adenylyltransferase [Acidobacteriota bacterium]|nr:D-glycero-beta-D-manno-heptose 1-phosphate adenylyltransferase [Acidobacteriota bacterium]